MKNPFKGLSDKLLDVNSSAEVQAARRRYVHYLQMRGMNPKGFRSERTSKHRNASGTGPNIVSSIKAFAWLGRQGLPTFTAIPNPRPRYWKTLSTGVVNA